MSPTLVPFTDDHLPAAGALLAARHARDRAARPGLPERFEDPAVARVAVEKTWRRPMSSGAAALEGERLVGYLIGQAKADTLRERHIWVALPGLALAADQDAALCGDLYAEAGPRWLAHGCFNHYALVPAHAEALLAAWFALSFGMEQVHGLCDLERLSPPNGTEPSPADLVIRQATLADRLLVADMHDVIARYQAGAPVWGATLPETLPEMRQGYGALVDEADVTVWLALVGKRAVGLHAYYPNEASDEDLLSPAQTTELHVAGTVEADRGRGIGRALTRHGLLATRAAGYRYCLADWRSTNRLAARFWPRQGFEPVAIRLVRRVDPRVLWATGRAV